MKSMRRYVLFLLFAGSIIACGKDKFATKPSLKIKSVNGNFVPAGATLSVDMEYTDKEGDVSNTLFVQKIRLNQKVVPTIRDTFSLTVPEFPSKNKGEILVALEYNNYLVSAINPPKTGTPPNERYEDDTLIIRFALRDLAGNVSDTVSTGTIIVSRN